MILLTVSAVARQIALCGGYADVGKRKAFRQVSHADQNAVGHALGELDRPGRRGEAGDSAGAESGCPFRGAADLENRHIFVRLQPQSLEKHSGRNIRGTPHSANADAFALQILRRFDRFVDDQVVGKRVDEGADANQIGPANRGIREGAPGDIANFDVPCNDSGHVRCRAGDED